MWVFGTPQTDPSNTGRPTVTIYETASADNVFQIYNTDGTQKYFDINQGATTPYIYFDDSFGITNADEDPQCAVCLKSEDGFGSRMGARYFGTSSFGGRYVAGRARGTVASPATIQTNDIIGDYDFRGYDGGSSNAGFAP